MKVKRVKSANMYCVTEKTDAKGKEHFEQNWFSTLQDAYNFMKENRSEQRDNV